MSGSRPFHILHLVLSLQVGGAERVVANLLRGQQGHNLKQSVCCLDEVGVLGEELVDEGFAVHVLARKPGIDFRLIWKLRSFCRQQRVDLIHTHGESPWFYGALASWLYPWSPVPCITTIHGYGGGDRQELKGYRLWKFLSLLSGKVVFVSDIFRRELAVAGMAAKKMTTIVNGVEFAIPKGDDFTVTGLKSHYAITNEFIIGIVARLSAVKNYALLLQAVAGLKQKGSRPFRLLIVGDGPERKRLETLTKELGLDLQVVFCGEQSDVAAHYALFDVFVLPSFSEGISMTILEAMAAGVPVIASAVGGNEEIVTHEENGYLFPSNDVEGLEDRLRNVMEHPEQARNLACAGQQTVQTVFSMQTMLQRYRQVYGEVLGLPGPLGEAI